MNSSVKFPIGDVVIKTLLPLDGVAKTISGALSINLKKAPTGRFEEYEGYQCDAMGFVIRLLGDDHFKPATTVHEYQLSVAPSNKLSNNQELTFEEVDISSFLQQFLKNVTDLEISV